MVDKILLHIGAEKTGSTSLQGMMASNPKWLTQAKAHYPVHTRFPAIRANGKLLTFALKQEFPAPFKRAFPDQDVTALDPKAELELLLDQCPSGTKTAVLSSELLRPHNAADLKALLPRGVACEVVLIVRRQDDWVQSFYSQCLKGGQNISLDDLIEQITEPTKNGLSCPDWAWHHEVWQETFGTCTVIFFDDPETSYQTAFFDLLGAQPATRTHQTRTLNQGLDRYALAYLSNLHRDIPSPDFLPHVKACLSIADTQRGTARHSILSARHRQRLVERFAEGNWALAESEGMNPSVLSIGAPDATDMSLAQIRQTEGYHRFLEQLTPRLPAPTMASDPHD